MKPPSRRTVSTSKGTLKGSERLVGSGKTAKDRTPSFTSQGTKPQVSPAKSQHPARATTPSNRARPETVPTETGNRWPEGELLKDDDEIVRAWAVEHGLERVARIVVALAEPKPGRPYSNESEAMQWMAARRLADEISDVTTIATEAAALITRKSAGRENLIKRLAQSFSENRLQWLWYETQRKAPTPALLPDASRPSPAHEGVIHRIIAMFPDHSVDLYSALLQELRERDSHKLAFIESRKKKKIEELLATRLEEHQTGNFTEGANRTARTLFDLIAWDLAHLNSSS